MELQEAAAADPGRRATTRRWDETHDDIFTDEFLLTRPLLTAIRREEPTVLLVDEVDKTDVEVEGLLLEVLSDFQVTIPELGTVAAVRRPFVVLTSNATRELSEAVKRRCLSCTSTTPTPSASARSCVSQVPEARGAARRPDRRDGRPAARAGAAEGALDRRVHRLGAHPGRARASATSTRTAIDQTLGVVLKHASDHERAVRELRLRAGREPPMTLLDRHIAFVEALRGAGLPVSLAEDLDAVARDRRARLGERETLRAAYAATLVKRQHHRPAFDHGLRPLLPARWSARARSDATVRDADGDARTTQDVRTTGSRRPAGARRLPRARWPTALATGDPDALATAGASRRCSGSG